MKISSRVFTRKRDVTDTGEPHSLSTPFFRDARKAARNALIWAGITLGNPLIFNPVVDMISPLLIPQWGADSIARLKRTPTDYSMATRECAQQLGEHADSFDNLLKEVENHSPRYAGRVEARHTQLKWAVVKTVKKYFPESFPKAGNYYIQDDAFHTLITQTVPQLMAPNRTALNPHYYKINCEGAPQHFNLNFEIAHIEDYGTKGFELWGSKVKREVTVLGENYSHINGSKHEYSIGEWLGLYSGQIFINEETSENTIEYFYSYAQKALDKHDWFNLHDSIDYMSLML